MVQGAKPKGKSMKKALLSGLGASSSIALGYFPVAVSFGVAAVQADLKETEFERAYDIWERKFGQAPTDQKAYAKQYRFMANRGFGSGVLRRILERFNDSF